MKTFTATPSSTVRLPLRRRAERAFLAVWPDTQTTSAQTLAPMQPVDRFGRHF